MAKCKGHLHIRRWWQGVAPSEFLRNGSQLGAPIMGQVAGPALSESVFPVPPAWQLDAACGLEIQRSDGAYPPAMEIPSDSTGPLNNFRPSSFCIFESFRHLKRGVSLVEHVQERREAHFELLTYST